MKFKFFLLFVLFLSLSLCAQVRVGQGTQSVVPVGGSGTPANGSITTNMFSSSAYSWILSLQNNGSSQFTTNAANQLVPVGGYGISIVSTNTNSSPVVSMNLFQTVGQEGLHVDLRQGPTSDINGNPIAIIGTVYRTNDNTIGYLYYGSVAVGVLGQTDYGVINSGAGMGVFGAADQGGLVNVGVDGLADATRNGQTNIGMSAIAFDESKTGGATVGGYFETAHSFPSDPVMENAVTIFDNRDTLNIPLQIWRLGEVNFGGVDTNGTVTANQFKVPSLFTTPTNTPSVGQVVTYTSTAGDTEAADLPFTIYTGNTNIGNLATSLVISIGHTMTSTNYTPAVSFMGSALAAAVAPTYSARTTTTFTLNLSAGISGGENLSWSVVYAP